MAKLSKLKQIRKDLIGRCNTLLRSCRDHMTFLEIGQRTTAVVVEQYYKGRAVSDSDRIVGPVSGSAPSELDLASRALIITHADLVQEWHIFLDAVFSNAVFTYLQSNREIKLSNSNSIRFSDLSLVGVKGKKDVFGRITESLAESFSFHSHKSKIEDLGRLFPDKMDSTLLREIIKHIEIRNIFQHNRGQVRSDDLKKIGRPKQCFEVLDENGELAQYSEGQKIQLSLRELEKFVEMIEKVSHTYESLL